MFKTAMRKLILILLLLPSFCQATIGTMGYASVGGTKSTFNNWMRGSAWIVPASGTADTVRVYIKIKNDDLLVRAAIYKITGTDTNFVDSSAEASFGIGDGWCALPLLHTPSLTKYDTILVLAWGAAENADDTVVYASSSGITRKGYSYTYSGQGWPSSITGFQTNTGTISIYLVYTLSADVPNYVFGAVRTGISGQTMNGAIGGGHFIPSIDGYTDSITAMIYTTGACSVSTALYICQSTDTVFRDSSAHSYLSAVGIYWKKFALLSGVAIDSDSTYVIAIRTNASSGASLRYATACAEPTSASNCPTLSLTLAFTSAWPSSLTGQTINNTREASIFCNYHVPAIYPSQGSFGFDTLAATKYRIGNRRVAEAAFPPCQGIADTIVAYMIVHDALLSRAALYKCAGAETLLVDSSAEKSVPTGADWVKFPLLNAQTIAPPDTYLITIWVDTGDGTDSTRYNISNGIARIYHNIVYTGAGWPSDWSGGTRTANNSTSIYCLFTPASQIFGAARQANNNGSFANIIVGGHFIPVYDGVADSFRVMLNNTNVADSFKAALYVCAGADTLLRDSSAKQWITTLGLSWKTFDLLGAASIYNESTYVLTIWADNPTSGTANVRYSTVCREATSATNCPYATKSYDFTTYGWESNMTGTTVTNNREVSIFCYYHTAVPSGPVNYIHGYGGAGVVHSASGASVLHGP